MKYKIELCFTRDLYKQQAQTVGSKLLKFSNSKAVQVLMATRIKQHGLQAHLG